MALYHHEQLGALECIGCLEMIEIPKMAIIDSTGVRRPVKGNPENLVLWRELHDIKHGSCTSFQSLEAMHNHQAHGLRRLK